jgi:hypothetical protein
MAGPIATLRVLLTGDDAELRKKLKSSDKKTRDWAKNQIKHTKRVRQAFKMSAAAVGATAVAYAGLTRAAIKSADHLAKTADKIGVTVEGLQELRFAADRAGVDVRKFDMGLQRFARRLGEAQQGTGILQKELQTLGIQLRNNDGSLRTTEAVLGDYADAIKAAQTPQEQLRLAFKAFDSEGAALVNMLKNGSAGLDDMRQKATDLGLVMGESTARKAEQLSDQFGTLSDVFQNKLNTALVESAHENWPAIVSAMDSAESAMYRMKQVMHLATGGVHVLRAGIARGAAGMISFGRSIADGVTKGVDIMGIQMQIMSQKVKLGVLRAVNAATSAGDAALSKAPEFVKAFFGYQSGDLSAGTDAMIANAETTIAELQGKLTTARDTEESQPSLIEQALLGVAGEADAAVETAVAKAFEAQQRIDEIKANGGTASLVSETLGFGGDPAEGGDGSGTGSAEKTFEEVHALKAKEMADEKKLVDIRRNTMQQTLGFLQKQVKGGSVAAKAIMAGMTALNIAQIISNTEVAKMRALAELGPIAGPPMAAAIQAQGMISAGIAAAQGIQGMFHDGIDNVPNTGTYLLEKGERVVDRRLNEDLTQALAAGGGGVGGGSNTLSINVNGVSDADTINRVISEQRPQFEQMLRDINSDNAGQGLL